MDSAPVNNTSDTNLNPTEGDKPKIIEEPAVDTGKLSSEVILRGLNFAADENAIGKFMANFGEVIKVNLLRNEDKRSKGTAFVTFDSEEAVTKAVAGSNTEFMGRYLVIERTKPKSERSIFKQQQAGNEDSRTIFVGNLSFKSNSEDLKDFFSTCGKVLDARVATNEGKSKGFGHVEFEDRSGVENALKISGKQLDGRAIRVDVAAQFQKREPFKFRH